MTASSGNRSLSIARSLGGRGHTEADGSFRLDQVVTFADGATEKRTWRLVRLDARTYTATLSDAAGPVSAEVTGNHFHFALPVAQTGDLRAGCF